MFSKRIVLIVSFAAVMLLNSAITSAQNTTSPSARDKKFIRLALEGGSAEVAMGQLAVQKGSSQDVKQFGQKMIEDRTHLGDQMRDVAEKEHLHPPRRTDPKDKALEDRLKKLSGASFDKMYIVATVSDQRRDLDQFNEEANHGNDTAIKEAASSGALFIGRQLQAAEQIARNHNVKPRH